MGAISGVTRVARGQRQGEAQPPTLAPGPVPKNEMLPTREWRARKCSRNRLNEGRLDGEKDSMQTVTGKTADHISYVRGWQSRHGIKVDMGLAAPSSTHANIGAAMRCDRPQKQSTHMHACSNKVGLVVEVQPVAWRRWFVVEAHRPRAGVVETCNTAGICTDAQASVWGQVGRRDAVEASVIGRGHLEMERPC